MGRGEGCMGDCCTCIFNVIRSIPYLSIVACSGFVVGFIMSMSVQEDVFNGLALSGFDLSAIAVFMPLVMWVVIGVMAFILLVSFFTTGWCMEKCCNRDANDGCCTKCFQCLFGVFAQYVFWVLCAGAVVLFFILVVIALVATMIAALEKGSCDQDATVPWTDKPIIYPTDKDAQLAAAALIQMVAAMPVDGIPVLEQDPAFAEAKGDMAKAKELGVTMCCGKGFDTATAIDYTCAVGTCVALDEADTTANEECGKIKLDKDSYPDGFDKKKFRDDCAAANEGKCYVKSGAIGDFLSGSFTLFIGMTISMFATVVQLLHVQKTLSEVSMQIDHSADKNAAKSAEDGSAPLNPEGSAINYTAPDDA